MKSSIHRDTLGAILELATAPHESAMLVVGEPGSGKSRLLASVEPIPGIEIFRVRINPAEAGFPLSGLSAFVASFQTPAAAALSSELLIPGEADAQLAARAAELLALIRDFTPETTLLLIDDLDLMDLPSQTVFAMVAARLGGTGLRLVGTVCAEPPVGPLASLPRITLDRLTFAESMLLATELLGPQSDEALRRMLASSSSGSPSEIARNARLLTSRHLGNAAPVALPFRASRAPSTRTSQEPDDQHLLLAMLSCSYLSSQDPIRQSGDPIRGALEELLSAGTVIRDGRYLRISDSALRSHLYWSIDAGTRAEFHARAARSEDAPGGDPGLAAWHRSWADAGSLSSDELLASAAEFGRRGLIWQSVELAERALALALDATGSPEALLEVAEALYLQGELSYAARYARLGQRRPGSIATVTKLATLRSGIEFMSTHQLLTTDLDDWVGPRGASGRAEDLARLLGMSALSHAERWEVDAAREALARGRHLLESATPESIELHELSALLLSALEGDPGPSTRMFERLSRHGWTEETSARALSVLGRSLTFIDRYGDARRVLRTVVGLEPPPDPIVLQTARYYLAENEILAGNQFEAMAIIESLTGSGTEQVHRRPLQLLTAWYWQARGDRARADAAIELCNRSFATSDHPALAARLVADQGRFALMEGRFDDAIAFLHRAGAIGSAFRNPSLLRSQVDLIEAYVLSGRLREAVIQFREFRARARPFHTRWTVLATARAEALLTPGEASIAVFEQAAGLWQPGDSQFEQGRTLLSFADRLVSLGHGREGADQYLAARMIFTQLGAIPWARKADAVRLGTHAPSVNPLLATLAPDERLVAELVQQGKRNKEIAAELFVSLRTVEVRLTRTYNKLGAKSRSHLIALLSGTGTVLSDGAASGMV
ncbi:MULTISPECIES: helix-turn-helix transcriptional regulator [Cryobacterium]|uniref:HTH luxR-type domain-containing protein n=2 Tax=Bacteria TaxID=2 RepID=A0ABY2IIP4_9MICO|nr:MULTISPECIES: LuxR C-terminal-related transcriptional regulator [Cryobacterium]MEB0285408.1 LuxR C-terminal-related transcriptional regulator [Cryobacterium sp. 10S3]TFC17231.1 hypothetical protein E3O46_16410 [Cryobacterium glucosi]WPX13340.1 LuxR C-terminal-related transcriptional regulator [Cryobacterium sp. 10S3]